MQGSDVALPPGAQTQIHACVCDNDDGDRKRVLNGRCGLESVCVCVCINFNARMSQLKRGMVVLGPKRCSFYISKTQTYTPSAPSTPCGVCACAPTT